jgi:hypothetical protein
LHGSGGYRILTSAFLQSRAGFVAGIVILLGFLPLAEHRVGSMVATSAFFLGDWVSSLIVMIGLRLVTAVGSAGTTAATHALAHQDSGSSAGLYACGAAAVSSFGERRWRLVLGLVLIADLVIEGAVTRSLASVQHPVAVVVGAAVASVSDRHRRAGRGRATIA